MIEVHQGVFVGHKGDCPLYGARQAGSWATVHACQTCHKQALGYITRGAPKGPEYYRAQRGSHLLLNMVDVEQARFFNKEELIDPALVFIDATRAKGANILIHCDQGGSRSPALALLYLATRLGVLATDSLEAAEREFRALYPAYAAGSGIREHLRQNWQQYCAEGKKSA